MQNKSINLDLNFSKTTMPAGKRVLMACVPADGHFNPLTGIAKQLQSNGYDVRWYVSKEYSAKLNKLQIPHYPFNKAMELTAENVDQAFPERNAIRNPVKKLNFDIINFFINRGPEYYADIQDIYKKFRFDLVIADCAFSAIPFIKEKMNIPVISIGVFPLTEKSKDLAPNGLGLTPIKGIFGKVKHRFLHLLADHLLFRQANKVMKQVLANEGIEINNINLFDLLVKKSTLLLQSGTPGFEYKRSDLSSNIRYIGPLLPYHAPALSASWFDKRLHEYDKVLLVTQGTVEKNVSKLLLPALEAFKNSDVLLVVTTGGAQTQELKEKYPYSNIIIEDFIRFEDVMPYADAYITNGGYGGVMLGIQNRLPLIVAGEHEGKNEINARIGYFNLGINLKTEKPSPLQLKAAVEEVLANKQYKRNVDALANEFSQYDPAILSLYYVDSILKNKQARKPLQERRLFQN